MSSLDGEQSSGGKSCVCGSSTDEICTSGDGSDDSSSENSPGGQTPEEARTAWSEAIQSALIFDPQDAESQARPAAAAAAARSCVWPDPPPS